MKEQVKIRREECPFPPELNKDGTISYFSMSCEVWFLNIDDITSYDLKYFSDAHQKAIKKHLKTKSGKNG